MSMFLEGNLGCVKCSDKHGTCVDRIPLFDFLSHEEKKIILEKSIHRFYKKGELIFSPGEAGNSLYIINSGEVKIFKLSPSGKEQILHILSSGDFLGEHSLFSSDTLKNSAQAMKNTALCVLKGEDIKSLILQYPEMGLKFLEKYSKKNIETLNLVESIGLYDVEQRLAKYLLDQMEESGSPHITLSMSKGTLASLIGTSQETLSRRLSYLQDCEVIRLQGQRSISILNVESLEQILSR
ncbi:MAG TPA: Crp/Fnr family transcriptional regulator [Clostridiaceae bacterium]|nr:Crp/Fnr family transcriptional regulator [Clostridiaceae bacterium]